jgi:hypothetical protein
VIELWKSARPQNSLQQIGKYKSAILPDRSTTVSEMLHLIALQAVSTRMALVPSMQALAQFSNGMRASDSASYHSQILSRH